MSSSYLATPTLSMWLWTSRIPWWRVMATCTHVCVTIYAVVLQTALHHIVCLSQGQRATSLQDKSDGLTAQPHNEELSKLLRKLGYPEVVDGIKPSTLLAKAISACQKRMTKLKELMPNRPKAPEDDGAAKPKDSKESKEALIQQRPGPEISPFLPRSSEGKNPKPY